MLCRAAGRSAVCVQSCARCCAGTRCSWELLPGTCTMCPCWPHWGFWGEAIFNQKILIAELFLNALLMSWNCISVLAASVCGADAPVMPNTRVRKSGSFAASSSLLTPTFTFQLQHPPATTPCAPCSPVPSVPCCPPHPPGCRGSGCSLQSKQQLTHCRQPLYFPVLQLPAGISEDERDPLCLPCSKMSTQLPASLAHTQC